MSDFVPQGPPRDVDPPTHGRVARTFYVYRIVRSVVIGVIALVALPVFVIAGAPWYVAAMAGLIVVLMALRVYQTRQRWQRAQASFAG